MKRLVVVTGAARGWGKALVDEFSASGWVVVAASRSQPDPLAWTSPGMVETVMHDVRADDFHELHAVIGERPVDLLINNAAQGAEHQGLGSISTDGVMNAVDVNVGGPLRLVQALLPNLLAASEPIIINVTSRLGSVSAQARDDFSDLSTSYAYKISKAAQNMLTISLAQELQGRIRAWAVHPGKLSTGMGQPDASKDPRLAARQLRELVDSGDPTSPRFCSLGETDLAW
ncbi:short-chain dehydrogenase [Arthrobacter sp. ERGS1:01]|uniref:SDR family NAD(P)-dependent oxidoreductase n=1 Tax=Arthrobacter sp. ERGS1:01 TaxID=1704044 RepID=UPI0006B4120B|nr:SDR family NAD(P)-dependent oxidoreductase [Arthrobacter sp. ERGS1:01]ALE06857.1 short-chain dehydrogenase [Arthrobacter sp. ERGS1:01]